jgi:hypothetical protein
VAPAARQGGTAGCPLGRGPPRSRVKRSLGRGLPSSRAQRPLGQGPPRSRAKRPLGRGPPRSMAPARSRRPRSYPRVRAFNALTPQDARHDPYTPGNPRRCQPCAAIPATAASRRALRRHPQRFWRARGRYVAMTATVTRTDPPPSNRPAGGGRTTNHYAATLEAAPVRAQNAPRRPDWSRIRQDNRQLHGTVRHASTCRRNSAARIKLLPPWPIKGEAVPQPRGRGTTDSDHVHALRLHHDIGTCLNQYLWDLETRLHLPPRL